MNAASSMIGLISSYTPDPSSTQAARLRVRATKTTIPAVTTRPTPTVTPIYLPEIDTASACNVLSSLSAACSSASPQAWGSSQPNALSTNVFTAISATPYAPSPSSTSTSSSATLDAAGQASCVCYSSSWFVPDVWNTAAALCGGGGSISAELAGLCVGPTANVRGWQQKTFGEEVAATTTTSGIAAAATGLRVPGSGRDSVIMVVVVAVLVGTV